MFVQQVNNTAAVSCAFSYDISVALVQFYMECDLILILCSITI